MIGRLCSMRVLVLVLVFASVWGASRTARACSCLQPPPPADAFAQADVVFEGRPYATSVEGASATFSFEVDRFWKGDPGERVDVATATSSAACGRSYEIGTPYLVYARRIPGAEIGDTLCSRTRTLMAAEEDLEVLGPGSRPAEPRATEPGEPDAMPREPPRIPTADAGPPAPAPTSKRGCSVEMPHSAGGAMFALAGLVGVAIVRRRTVRSARPTTRGAADVDRSVSSTHSRERARPRLRPR